MMWQILFRRVKALLCINAFCYRNSSVVYGILDTVVYQFLNIYLQVVNRYETSQESIAKDLAGSSDVLERQTSSFMKFVQMNL